MPSTTSSTSTTPSLPLLIGHKIQATLDQYAVPTKSSTSMLLIGNSMQVVSQALKKSNGPLTLPRLVGMLKVSIPLVRMDLISMVLM